MKRRLIVLSVSAVCLTATSASAQAADQLALFECQQAAEEVVRFPHAESDSLRFSQDTRVSRKSNHEMVVKGGGEFQHRRGSRWHVFTFQCSFDPRSGEASKLTVRFRPSLRERTDWRNEQRHARGVP